MTNEHVEIVPNANQAHTVSCSDAADEVASLAEVKIRRTGTTAFVEIIGEIDRSNAGAIEKGIHEGTGEVNRVVIDLSAVGYLDSAALSMLQTSALRISAMDLIAPTGSRARRLLDIAGIDLALSVFENVAEANVAE
jgi:anti-anti-sigma factor